MDPGGGKSVKGYAGSVQENIKIIDYRGSQICRGGAGWRADPCSSIIGKDLREHAGT